MARSAAIIGKRARGRVKGSGGHRLQRAALAASRLSQVAQARELADIARGTARTGVAGANTPLPYLSLLQSAFGPNHDLSSVAAAIGGPAQLACNELGAHGFATGNTVGFGRQPSLWETAHEVAHVVQQRAGQAPRSGLGRPGDTHERLANQVADRVVAGQGAAGLLVGGGGSSAVTAVQLLKKDEAEVAAVDQAEEEDGPQNEEADAQAEEEAKAMWAEAKALFQQFDARFLKTQDYVGFLGSWLPALAEASLLGPAAASGALARIQKLCSSAFSQWAGTERASKGDVRESIEGALNGVDLGGLASDPGFDKQFTALLIKMMTQLKGALHKAGSGGRVKARAWGSRLASLYLN